MEQGCTSDDCDGLQAGRHGKCHACIAALAKEGWRVTPTGHLKNAKSGTSISPNGRVTVSANLNPRTVALLAGDISVEDLDDLELARGVCRNPDGKIPKNPPKLVPRSMHQRMQRELFERSDTRLREGLIDAVESITAMIADKDVSSADRLKAAQWLFERLRGKTPDVVEFKQDKPYEVLLTQVTRGPRPDSHTSGLTRGPRTALPSEPTPGV